jgi:DNA-directed RNA polymerase specialized sigma24 family protein
MAKVKKEFYVSNKDLYAAMLKYKESIKLAEEQNKPKPRVPEYIGRCILLIGQRLATKPSFRRYSYAEELIGDGTLACIRYIDNFNCERSNNPFAYFTQIMMNAFINRLNGEQKQQYVRARLTKESMSILNEVPDVSVTATEFIDSDPNNNVIDNFERRMAERKKRSSQKKEEREHDAAIEAENASNQE